MTIEARIIADTLSPTGRRLTTFVLKYPRVIHSEFMTHRVMARNASSSRAIPVEKNIAAVLSDPYIPLVWGKNQKGMQSKTVMDETEIEQAKIEWLKARDAAAASATQLAKLGLHKQFANRVLEPFAHISVVCTATDYKNFYGLRRHVDAMPEIHALADAMFEAHEKSIPYLAEVGYWHLPFITRSEREQVDPLQHIQLAKASVARCARTSYNKHDGTSVLIAEDIILHDKLLSSTHMSPFEHQAQVTADPITRSGNFAPGFIQYRKMIPNENGGD